MKTFFQTILYLFIAFIGMLIFLYFIGSSSSDEEKKRINKIANYHCTVDWETATNKKKLMREIIKNPDINRDRPLALDVVNALTRAAKYPSTIKIKGEPMDGYVYMHNRTAYEIDTVKGTYQYIIPFTCENKISQTVKSQLTLYMKYTAGCQPTRIVNVEVE
jgi:hypothetical protein